MSDKHTPGPWREQWVRPNRTKGHTFDPKCAILAESDLGTVRVADIPDPLSAEEEANARLIAAAPELLVSVRELLDELDEMSCECGEVPNPDGCSLCRARALLARVQGED